MSVSAKLGTVEGLEQMFELGIILYKFSVLSLQKKGKCEVHVSMHDKAGN
jgi:hypothetical protein